MKLLTKFDAMIESQKKTSWIQKRFAKSIENHNNNQFMLIPHT